MPLWGTTLKTSNLPSLILCKSMSVLYQLLSYLISQQKGQAQED